jgi:molybdopterin-guanine dinucleotide biosynthesis protein A
MLRKKARLFCVEANPAAWVETKRRCRLALNSCCSVLFDFSPKSSILQPLSWYRQRDKFFRHFHQQIRVACDENPGRGPLEGLAAGLKAMPDHVEAVYATSCDVPLMATEFVRAMFNHLGNHEIAVPVEGQFHHPLAAVYRPRVLTTVQQLLNANRLRPRFLFDEVDTIEVDVESLREFDPTLSTLMNLNHPDDYEKALQQLENHTLISGGHSRRRSDGRTVHPSLRRRDSHHTNHTSATCSTSLS